MGYRDMQVRYFLLARIIILISLIGLGVLVFANLGEDPSHLTFSLIAFGISVAALLVTILQSITISRQMQLTQRAVREVREISEQLKDLVSSDHRLVREVHEDIELDHEVIAALEEHDTAADDKKRRKVAKKITRKAQKKSKNTIKVS
ncbi:MAG: hypothetical protein H6797_04785 [Candidatus Nomurabacteria bacterium]|nr:MAG: hypothetical protein H6797_04785 [Candidatus Nomurabacteria bacterium]